MITPTPDQGTPAFDGRITGGRKGIPYDLSQFAVVASPMVVEDCDRLSVATTTGPVGEPVLVAA